MNLALMIFLVLAVLLVFLLAWAARPPKRTFHNAGEVLDALSEERHYARLPQILQALREDDTDCLREAGQTALAERIRGERTAIALRYLGYLEEEFQILLEASRIVSSMAPELSTMREFDRFKRSVRFMLCCRYLRCRLRLGMQPWSIFGTISDMAGDMTLQLEAAAVRIEERAMIGYDSPSLLQKRRGNPN